MANTETPDFQLSVSGYKPVAIIAATIVGAYAAKKFVDKFTNSSASVKVNAEAKSYGK